MPWRESCAMDERMRFIVDCRSNEWTMTELCERYEISRNTGYRWLGRYQLAGPAGLAERSRAPASHGRATPEHLAQAIVSLRRDRPTWGPRKILAKLKARQPEADWPAGFDGRRNPEAGGAGVRSALAAAGAAAAWRVDRAAIRQPCLERRPQRLDSARRRLAGRTVDDDRRVQPLSDQRLGHRQHAARRSPAAVRTGFSGIRLAGDDPLRQRRALRLDRRFRTDGAVGLVDQPGHPSRADRSGPSPAEWPARTVSSHASGGDEATRTRSGGTAAPFRPFRQRL